MIKSVFLDANILIDIYDSTRSYHEYSYRTVEYLIKNGVDIYTSSDIITTVYYILKKQFPEVLKYLKKLSIICNLVGFTNVQLDKAIDLIEQNDKLVDLEDVLQYISAKEIGCDLIISNDINFPKLEIEILTSKDFYTNIIENG